MGYYKQHANKTVDKCPALLPRLKKIANSFNVKLAFVHNVDWDGEAFLDKRAQYIRIRLSQDEDWQLVRGVLSTFCHELAHVYCFREKIYYAYHRDRIQDSKAIIYTAYKAEKYVDQMGAQIMKELFPGIKYSKSYGLPKNKKSDRSFFNEILQPYREYLKKKNRRKKDVK